LIYILVTIAYVYSIRSWIYVVTLEDVHNYNFMLTITKPV